MENIKIIVKGNRAALLGAIDLVAGTVGQTCTFYFDDSWKSLNKKVSFKVGTTVLNTQKLSGNELTIPPQVLATAGLPLEIGVTGYTSDNSVITPTSWALLGTIKNGATVYGGSSGEEDDDIHVIYDGGVIV